jgi:prevent-host-death family protein
MIRTVDLSEARLQLDALIDAAERGEEIVITENGLAKARISAVAAPTRERRPSGLLQISYIADDFDAPLSEIP